MSKKLLTSNSENSYPVQFNSIPENYHCFCFRILPAVLLLFFSACAKNDNVTEASAGSDHDAQETLRNVSYGEDPEQIYDLYLPAGRSASYTKILVLIHGGGWMQGDKGNMEIYIPLLNESHPDHAILNLNYRLAQLPSQSAFPDQFLDLQQAFEHLTEKAVNWGIKPEFGLIGTSAGGHIALQYDSVYDSGNKVKMVCSVVGPTDFTDPFYSENPDFALLLQVLIDEEEYPAVNLARAVSPAFQVNANTSPTILFYGKDDNLVPLQNGLFLQEQLELEGVENVLTIYEGGHGDWTNQDNDNLQAQLKDFIDSHLAIEN